MAGILEYSTTAGSNSAINGIAILGSSSIKFGDDALRQILADQAANLTRNVNKAAGAYTALKTDHNQLWRAMGAVTINLTAAATLTDGWALLIKAEGGTVTVDPNGAETIDGVATLTIPDGASACIRCTGTAFVSVIFSNTVDPLNRYLDFWLSNNVADATNDIDITDQKGILATITKRLDAAWAVGTNQGGLDTGSIANTTYHVWLIRRPDTGVVDALFSASATSPTMPANYTQKRRIGSIIRSAGAILGFIQDGDNFQLNARANDINATNPGTSAVTRTLTVPIGIRVAARVRGIINNNITGIIYGLITDLSIPDSLPSVANTDIIYESNGAIGFRTGDILKDVFTNTSGQVRSRVQFSDAATVIGIQTLGWTDTRGRFA